MHQLKPLDQTTSPRRRLLARLASSSPETTHPKTSLSMFHSSPETGRHWILHQTERLLYYPKPFNTTKAACAAPLRGPFPVQSPPTTPESGGG
jgi:hypothetical protein